MIFNIENDTIQVIEKSFQNIFFNLKNIYFININYLFIFSYRTITIVDILTFSIYIYLF